MGRAVLPGMTRADQHHDQRQIYLYFKRAHGSAQLLGPPREQLRWLESEALQLCSSLGG